MSLVKINREALLKPLQAVSGIIERRHTLPILSNVLIARNGNQIDFVATDIEIEISARTVVDSEGESRSTTVGAKKLLDILKALPADSDVNLSLTDKRMQVKSGKSRFNLQTLPAEDFPRLAVADATTVKFSVQQKLLKSLFMSYLAGVIYALHYYAITDSV